jgi:hypothetical protein
MIKYVYWCLCKVLGRIFSTVLKNNQILNFMKIRPVEVDLFRAGGRTSGRAGGQKDRQT